ncbi:hypothetical protein PLICRDRAFT_175133 [Plicaturopsis crispa FD-325 SS-3]|nr:hypothetical protein PLICRDRAFT_175133 [Plicaturopsis crispa FD-325 SS-3]
MLVRSLTAFLLGSRLAVSVLGGPTLLEDEPLENLGSYGYDASDVEQIIIISDETLPSNNWNQEDLAEYGRPSKPERPPPSIHSHAQSQETTIYQYLTQDPEFSRFARIVSFSDEIVSLLNDTAAGVTLFAIPNRAFPHPRKETPKSSELADLLTNTDDLVSAHHFSDIVRALEQADSTTSLDSTDREELQKLLTAVLAYHVIPQSLDLHQLGENTTYSTSLTLHDGSLDGQPLRLRVKMRGPHHRGSVNTFSKLLHDNVKTNNGFIHAISGPLLPPPSIFETLFAAPSKFSFITSALQRTDLTGALEWSTSQGSSSGTPLTTFFAPSNRAFKKLPSKLRAFLFSPSGAKAFKKLLEYHVVPNFLLHSDYIHNLSSGVNSIEESSQWAENLYIDKLVPELHEHHPHHPHHPPAHGSTHQEDREDFGPQSFEELDHESGRRHHGHGGHPFWHQSEGHMPPPPPRFEGNDRHPQHMPPPPPQHPEHHHGPPGTTPPPHPRHACHPGPPPPADDNEPGREFHAGPPRPPPRGPPHRDFHPPPPPGRRPPPPPGSDRRPGPPHDEQFKSFGPPPRGPPPHHGPHPPPRPPPFHGAESGREPCSGPSQPGPKPHRLPHVPPYFAGNLTLPTLLAGHSLDIRVAKFKVTLPIPGPHKPSKFLTKFFVNGWSVRRSDVPSRNGAIHIIDTLLNPRPRPRPPPEHKASGGPEPDFVEKTHIDDREEWEDWEDWLPLWANEE